MIPANTPADSPDSDAHDAPAPAARIPDSVRRVFLEAFTAREIAEPLASFDASASAAEVRQFMELNDFDVVGIRRNGLVAGYVAREALTEGDCGRSAIPLEQATVRDEALPLLNTILEFNRAPFLFITLLGRVGAIVTRDDLQKAPVRMWLFGLLTLIEMRFTELIESHFAADEWMQCLSESRIAKARELLAERQRRNQSLRLFDCLQLADKGQIVARHETLRGATIFASRRQTEETLKMLERLRNNLAHAQDIVVSDWDTIVKLSEFVAERLAPRA